MHLLYILLCGRQDLHYFHVFVQFVVSVLYMFDVSMYIVVLFKTPYISYSLLRGRPNIFCSCSCYSGGQLLYKIISVLSAQHIQDLFFYEEIFILITFTIAGQKNGDSDSVLINRQTLAALTKCDGWVLYRLYMVLYVRCLIILSLNVFCPLN